MASISAILVVVRVGVADSALKHGVPYATVVQVVRTGDFLGAAADGLSWWVGAAADGRGYEVAGLVTDDGALIVVHAMPTGWRRR